jgi:hypothetical protein
MKFDLTKKVLGLDGKPIKNGEEDVTYRDIISAALQSNDPRESETAESKSKSFQVGLKIFTAKEVELSATEIAHILEKAGKFLAVVGYGRLKELLEPESKK